MDTAERSDTASHFPLHFRWQINTDKRIRILVDWMGGECDRQWASREWRELFRSFLTTNGH